ncbi:MAG: ATP-binding cassette domain-containing protein [Lachnospiraceae bacterium]|nr:ATP-binding cassette domain-containing protein [Lachnospiraceae bacterium]
MMKKKWIRKIGIIAGWLIVWQLVSLIVGNHILLTGPAETLKALFGLLIQPAFWEACVGSLFRIAMGFFGGMILGMLLAMGSARYKWLEEILEPVITLVKAIPVASFVVIFLIWWGSENLAIAISFCMVLPNIYINTLEGIQSTDRRLLEMARVFEISGRNQLFYIYRPAMKPFLDSAIKLAAGMSWKSGVAAEVIGLPKYAIGEQLYMSKIYLDTAGVLAWTLVIILLSTGFERVIMYLWKSFCIWEPSCRAGRDVPGVMNEEGLVSLVGVCKAYQDKKVLEDITKQYQKGKTYYFNSPSGSGKTTLFRLLAGLERPDKGTIESKLRSRAFLFQEDRLCEEYNALKNVELVTGDRELAKQHLLQLLEEEDIYKPCKALSGGMKRRVALARTMAVSAELILLDEPYNGLDEANRIKVRDYIQKYSKDSILMIASHIE